MKAFKQFDREINELKSFHESTLYAFNETESLLHFWKKKGLEFDKQTSFEHQVKIPTSFKISKKSKDKRKRNLNEIVYVRLISALEVFLVDLVRDVFLITKEPFKKQDSKVDFTHAEILSIGSTTNFLNKIINKECRKLSSSGFNEIIKYYKKHFDIELSGVSPGKKKMEEYHERRHLLVHKLGKTDSKYRAKYNTRKQGVSISDDYLYDCYDDLKSFCKEVNDLIIHRLKNKFSGKPRKKPSYQRELTFKLEFSKKNNNPEYLNPDYEFWCQDEFTRFSDILKNKNELNSVIFEYEVSGTFNQIRCFTRILDVKSRKDKFKMTITKDITNGHNVTNSNIKDNTEYTYVKLDETSLKLIENNLPNQPWETGIHKIVAKELNVPNKLVSKAIQHLIAKGIFKHQINGKIIEDDKK